MEKWHWIWQIYCIYILFSVTLRISIVHLIRSPLPCSIIAFHDLTLGGRVLSMFCAAAATTHILSAVTHVWPDNHTLVRGLL